MAYTVFIDKELAEDVVKYTSQKTYRELSKNYLELYPDHKMSPSKLWRIANRKTIPSAVEVANLSNVMGTDIRKYFRIFAF